MSFKDRVRASCVSLPSRGPRGLLSQEGAESECCSGWGGPSSLLRVLCLRENLRCTPQEHRPQGGQTWFLPLQTGDAEGSGQGTPCQDRASACGMSGLEETHPQQRGQGPVFPPAPTPSVEPETGLWLEWVTGRWSLETLSVWR